MIQFQNFMGIELSFTVRAGVKWGVVDIVVLGSATSSLNLNGSLTSLWAQRQTTKPGCTKVKLYQQSNLSEAQSFLSIAIGFDVVLYTEIWDAFSWVDSLIIRHPFFIFFPAVLQSRGISSLYQLCLFSKNILVPCTTTLGRFKFSLLLYVFPHCPYT